jgi:hypothetical protein
MGRSPAGLYLFAKDIAPSPGGASGPAVVNVAELRDGRWSEGPTGNTIGFWEVISDGDRIVAPQMGCADGGEVNNYGRCIPFGAVFDTRTGTWSELPPASREANQGVSGGALGQDRLLLTRLGHQVLNLSTDTWFQIPEIDERDDNATVKRTFAGAGPYGFAFGGDGAPGSRSTFSESPTPTMWAWRTPENEATSPHPRAGRPQAP